MSPGAASGQFQPDVLIAPVKIMHEVAVVETFDHHACRTRDANSAFKPVMPVARVPLVKRNLTA